MDGFNMDNLQKEMGLDKLKGIAAPGGADTGLKEAVEKTLAEPVIEDITIINAGKKNKADIPAGYEKIDGDLNEGAGGDYIYFAVKRGTDASRAINGLAVVSGKNVKAAAPAGFEKLGMDLNKGAGGRYIYLCIRRGKENAIRDIKVVSASKANPPAPAGYTMIPQDLNEKAGRKYIYLCYC